VIAAKDTKTQLIVSVHGADIDRFKEKKLLERFVLTAILRFSDQIVACSSSMAEDTIRAFPKVKEKVTFVHNGFSLSEFETAPKPCRIDAPFILAICHQVEKKGVDVLLKSFEIVQRKFPKLLLIIIGDGPLLGENNSLSRNMGLEKKVKFLGKTSRDEIKSLISACTLFVLPSREEPFGIVLLEASFYKKGIVSTKVGGIPEIIHDGTSGLLVEPDDYTDMANGITYLLENPWISHTLGRNAYLNLVENFLWKDKAEDYMRLFEGQNHAQSKYWTASVQRGKLS
jgi:glycosyltransferase involved in cell wall biosynthesis